MMGDSEMESDCCDIEQENVTSETSDLSQQVKTVDTKSDDAIAALARSLNHRTPSQTIFGASQTLPR
jgi:hypothetical protein